jgi:hypothetical protein
VVHDLNSQAIPIHWKRFPAHPEQGIFLARTGNFALGTENSQPLIIEIVYLFNSIAARLMRPTHAFVGATRP